MFAQPAHDAADIASSLRRPPSHVPPSHIGAERPGAARRRDGDGAPPEAVPFQRQLGETGARRPVPSRKGADTQPY